MNRKACLNSLYTEFHFLEVLLSLVWSVSPLLLSASTGNFRGHELYHAHSLASLQWSGPSDWKLPTVPEMELIKRQRSLIYTHLCQKGENAQASADQGFSTASQGSSHVHGTPRWNPPTSPYPTFFASAKPIAFVQSYSQSQARLMFVTTLGMDNFDYNKMNAQFTACLQEGLIHEWKQDY